MSRGCENWGGGQRGVRAGKKWGTPKESERSWKEEQSCEKLYQYKRNNLGLRPHTLYQEMGNPKRVRSRGVNEGESWKISVQLGQIWPHNTYHQEVGNPKRIWKELRVGRSCKKSYFYTREQGQGQGNTNYQEEGNPERVRKELKGGKSCEN